VDAGDAGLDLLESLNIPRAVGIVVSRGKATWGELTTILGTEDLYDLLELLMIEDHNYLVLKRTHDNGS
jgi:hypothetical protein